MLDALKFLIKHNNDRNHGAGLIHPAWFFFVAIGISSTVAVSSEISDPPNPTANAISSIIASRQHPDLTQSSFGSRADDLEKLYRMANFRLLWLGQENSGKNVAEALNVLSNAFSQGLNPNNYDLEVLRLNSREALKLKPTAVKKLARFDTALSLSILRYLHDLQYGRVNPQGINFKLKLREKKLTDFPLLISSALRQGTLGQLPDIVEPKLFQYQKLKQSLAQYRKLDVESKPFLLMLSKSLRPGEHHPQMDELKQKLLSFGDFTETETLSDTQNPAVYSKAIAEGVKKFQRRHGLTPDGVIGKGTASALNTPLNQRITQIELAMERLRWLPEIQGGAYIIVNIPAFQLWAFDDISKPYPEILNMKVVVGNALKTQTPVLMAEMRFIDFMPYWNVPYSIVKKEILPKLWTNPNYLQKENMEVVTGFGKGGTAVALSDNAMMLLKQNVLKIRQRPGKKNALGRVKFMFPNKEDVYLHDTPANSLFGRSRRDFSHGCVRVENPEGLAEFVLKELPEWDKQKIAQAMKTAKTQRVQLKRSIPVLFFYTTSFIDENGLAFYPDIYRHDEVLLEVLKKPQDLSDQSLFISNNTMTTDSMKTE